MPLYPAQFSGAVIAGNGTVGGSWSVAGHALGEDTPANHGLVAWAYDPTHNVNSTVLSSGVIYLTAVYVAASANVTKLYAHFNAAASSITAGQNFMGLYGSDGTRLATVNVDSLITSTGLITATVSSTAVTAGGMYWVAQVYNATTPPSVARGAGTTGVGTVTNIGLTAATLRYATNGTSQTSLPASITPSSNAATAFGGPWVAIG
ncbi:hypothetical protein [Streptomyces gilvus]|uniref:hypothetical protein n=1 Tax=Streptomyces gilvus TaxID=2920937 RepID=UPI001F0E5478|nr:hypothetical protein [Streptomyces sp. CME 23]MCH5677926.1 hypothetical protein [Streptomyces sp. CME 23]